MALKSIRSLSKNNPSSVYTLIVALKALAGGLVMPVYSVFLQARGLSLKEINQVNSVFMIFSALLELPTGLVADVISNKFSVILGLFFWGFGMFVYAISNDISHFYAAEIIAAIGSAFLSGSLRAWHKSTTNKDRRELQITNTQAETLAKSLQIAGSIVAGLIVTVAIWLPWALAGTATISAFVLATIYMLSDKPSTTETTKVRLRSWFRSTVPYTYRAFKNIFVSSKEILLLTTGMFLVEFAVQPLNMFWGPYFNNSLGNIQISSMHISIIVGFVFFVSISRLKIGILTKAMTALAISIGLFGLTNLFPIIETSSIGMIAVGISIAMIAGLQILKRIASNTSFSTGTQLTIATAIIVVPISIGFHLPTLGMVVMFILHEVGRGMLRESYYPHLNDMMNDENVRTTTLSVAAMMFAIARAAGLQFFGQLSEVLTVPETWMISTIIIAIASVLFAISFLLSRKE